MLDTIGKPVSWRGRGSIGFLRGPFSATLMGNYVGAYTNDKPITMLGAIQPISQVGAWTTFDLNLSVGFPRGDDRYAVMNGVRLGVTITNLFNSEPPIVQSGMSGNSSIKLFTHNALGRFVQLQLIFVYQASTEGDDVPDMSLPFGQGALIEAAAAANPNTIVVLQTGNPVRMPWADKVKAVVQGWYSGARGGEAIARVLFGEVNPSGRLPMTWPVDESQLPRPIIPGWGEPAKMVTRVDYNIEGSDVGYRWFARENKAPRYWFGHGLSYTRFTQTNLAVKGGATVTASIDVTNSGTRAGKDVVQLYLTARPGGAARRLLAFEKVDLKPGETRRITLAADPRVLATFDEKAHGWRIDAGDYEVGVGASAGDIALRKTVRLAASKRKP